jgi:uncharacterized protein
MKKLVYILVLIILTAQIAAAQQDTTWYDDRWKPTTKQKANFYRPAPVKQGNFYVIKDYYLDGTLQYQGMSTGLSEKYPHEGECIWYYADAKPSSIETYKNGKKNGRAVNYFPNGQALWELHYKDDGEDGSFTTWYSDGSLKLSGSYQSGRRRGLWTYYTMDVKKAGVINWE